METAQEAPAKEGLDIRDVLLKFHEKWYSANRMTVSLCGPQPLDELEELARRMFSGVANKNTPDVVFPTPCFAGLPQLQYAHPVQDARNFSLEFLTKDTRKLWRTKPNGYC